MSMGSTIRDVVECRVAEPLEGARGETAGKRELELGRRRVGGHALIVTAGEGLASRALTGRSLDGQLAGRPARGADAGSGISGVSSRQWIDSLSCTSRRKKKSRRPIRSTPTPMIFSLLPP